MLKSNQRDTLEEGNLLSLYSDNSFINKEGKIIKADELSFIGAGHNSSVWKYKNMDTFNALKIFFDDGRECSLSYDCYKTMKDLPLRRILKAKDLFYEYTDQPISVTEFEAYIMDYLEESKETSLLEIPTSVLLESTKLLEEDVKILAENGIRMVDVKSENFIINNNRELYLSDIDMYEVDNSFTEKEILLDNKIRLNWFFLTYLTQELENLEMLEELTSDECNMGIHLVRKNFRVHPSKIEVHKCFERLFSNYEQPKDYFLSRKK